MLAFYTFLIYNYKKTKESGVLMINRNSSIPVYVQLADLLREQMASGEIKPGDKLPSETEMIKKYKLGRLTIRDALSILVNEGLLEKHHGKGTFCKSNITHQKTRVDLLLNLSDLYFIPYYLRSICEVLESDNVNVVLSDTKNDVDAICSLLERILAEGSGGIIFQPTLETSEAPEKLVNILNKLTEANIPYIMIDTKYDNVPASYVIMDELHTGKIAADYFIRMGHTSLCAIWQKNRIDSIMRADGFSNALSVPPYKIENDDNLAQSLKTLLANHPDITGIFCYHDGIAKKCYDILNELHIAIPDKISVISVDDTIVASTLSPTLTSVIHPKENLGKAAANAMLSIISGKTKWPYRKVFEPSLAIRKSCIKK